MTKLTFYKTQFIKQYLWWQIFQSSVLEFEFFLAIAEQELLSFVYPNAFADCLRSLDPSKEYVWNFSPMIHEQVLK